MICDLIFNTCDLGKLMKEFVKISKEHPAMYRGKLNYQGQTREFHLNRIFFVMLFQFVMLNISPRFWNRLLQYC